MDTAAKNKRRPAPLLVVLAGPTAVGKTRFSIALAQWLGSDILSADARQIYQQMTIGTAPPTAEELCLVSHHFVASHSVFEPFSAAQYAQEALALLPVLFKKSQKNAVLVTGGSGLYIKALCDGFDEIPNVPDTVRQQLNNKLNTHGLQELANLLQEKDPAYAQTADLQNPQRVIRALEVYMATGKPFSSFRTSQKAARPFDILKIGIDRPREELYNRINRRVDNMVDEGLFREVEALFKHRNLNALQTVGYKEVFEHLDGHISKDRAIELIKQNSRRYAKRQLTWFKRDEAITWFHAEDAAGIKKHVEQHFGAY